jgi:peptidoglycan/xylan/chitin deacetylase (PgdA/CDA1 family)
VIGKLFYGTLHTVGITTLARHLQQGALILCYHNVVPSGTRPFGDPGLHLPMDRFSAQMSWLKDHYTVIPLSELVSRLERGRSVQGCAVLTFDDAYTGAVTVALPLLRKMGLPATMFVVAEAPGQRGAFWWDHPVVTAADSAAERRRRLFTLAGDRAKIIGASDQVLEAPATPETHLAADWTLLRGAAHAGLDLGAHTLTHRTLTQLGDGDLRRELEAARDIIADRSGVRPEAFSYPYGIWDTRVRDAVTRAGYRSAVTLEFGLNTAGIDLCALRRITVPAAISHAAFAAWTAGVRPRRASAA